MKTSYSCPVVEVNSGNVETLWPAMVQDIRNSSFIAIDAEMSGLGNKSNTFRRNAEERYKALRHAAMTRSLISIGCSCFRVVRRGEDLSETVLPFGTDIAPDEMVEKVDTLSDNESIYCHVRTYNILLLCSDSFYIDSEAVSFLVKHGFDFNKQYSLGIKYHKGNELHSEKEQAKHSSYARKLFGELVRVRKPVVFHNAFADLVFLYECLYASSPPKLNTFLADLSEMFPSGIYDTKHIASTQDKMRSSFLSYVFRKYEMFNLKQGETKKPAFSFLFNDDENNIVSYQLKTNKCKRNKSQLKETICVNFSKYGWCRQEERCALSHNIDEIIHLHDLEEAPKKRKRKGRTSKESVDEEEHLMDVENPISQPDEELVSDELKKSEIPPDNEKNGGGLYKTKTNQNSDQKNGSASHVQPQTTRNSHRAGLDSFMTGYCFATYILKQCQGKPEYGDIPDQGVFSAKIPFLQEKRRAEIMNRVFMSSGSHVPLWICRSHFAKTSKNHDIKYTDLCLT